MFKLYRILILEIYEQIGSGRNPTSSRPGVSKLLSKTTPKPWSDGEHNENRPAAGLQLLVNVRRDYEIASDRRTREQRQRTVAGKT